VAKNLFTHLGKSFLLCLSVCVTNGHCWTICVNDRHLWNLMKRMTHIIKWAITDRKGDYTQNPNHKIKRALKMMAEPYHIITPGHFHSYQTVSTNRRICHCWFIVIAGAKIDPVVEQIVTTVLNHWLQSSYQLVQLIHAYCSYNLCFCPPFPF